MTDDANRGSSIPGVGLHSQGTDGDTYVERIFHGGTTGTTDFKLCVLSKAHPHYPSLTDQFANKWVKPEPVGGVSIEKIFTVEVS